MSKDQQSNPAQLLSLINTQQQDKLDKSIPRSIEAEQALIGASLVSPGSIDKILTLLSKDDFFEPLHAEIFNAMANLVESGRAVTAVTLDPLLQQSPAYTNEGGIAYLTYLASSSPPVSSIPDLAMLLAEYSTRRKLINIGEEIVLEARDVSNDQRPKDQVESAERLLYSIAESKRYGGGFRKFSSASDNAMKMAEAALKRSGGLTGISTGLIDLDKYLGGLQASDLLILAGRPSMGKTALATNIAVSVARKVMETPQNKDGNDEDAMYQGGVGFFSLEMSAEQLATRVISEQCRLPSTNIRRGNLQPDEFERMMDAARELDKLPLYIDETGGLTVGQLAARARRLKRQHGLSLIVIDYVQLLHGSRSRSSDSRTQEVTEITTTLKALAKELNVPIIAAAQLSRQVENREGNRPQLSDLRESGSIEQDADVVMFVYRKEYYLERNEPDAKTSEAYAKWQTSLNESKGIAEIIIGKQRHGPTKTVKLAFQSEYTRFTDLAQTASDYPEAQSITHELGD